MRASLNSLSSARANEQTYSPAGRLNARAARWTPPWRWALAQHRTSFSQPGHIRQRAVVPRWPEEPLAQLSWASSPWHRRRSCTDICDQACGCPSLRRDSRPSRGSAALAFPTSGFSTESVRGQHAWSQMHGRLRRRCAVLKKIAARFSLRGLRARIDAIARATESHGVRRATIAVARRTGAQRACRVVRLHTAERVEEPSFEGQARHRLPLPLLAGMPRVEYFSVCRARGVRSGRLAPARAPARSARGVTCDT